MPKGQVPRYKRRKRKGERDADIMIRGTNKAWMVWLALGFLILAPNLGRGAPDGEAFLSETMEPVSDARVFFQELNSAGALKFFENTEDLLRIAQFERALLRYYFLKDQIGRQSGYRPLVIMINKRLDFLKVQLKLPETDYAALMPPKARKGRSQKVPAVQAAPPSKPPSRLQPAAEAREGGGEASIPPGANSLSPQADLAATPSPYSPGNQQQSENAQVQEQNPPEVPPGPPPSRWQRLKKRLLFWRR